MATVYDAQADIKAAEDAWARRDLEATSVRLSAFWQDKASAWTSDPTTQQQLTSLDADAHSIWARMEDLKAMQADTGSPERTQHAQTAAQAWAKAAALKAQSGGIASTVQSYQRLAAASAASPAILDQTIIDTRYSTAFKDQAGKVAGSIFGADLLGVPVWAWVAGLGLLTVAIVAGRR
jgi:hypothetical protein